MVSFILRLLPSWAWALVIAAAVATIAAAGWMKGAAHVQAKWDDEKHAQTVAAMEQRIEWEKQLANVRNEKNAELQRIGVALGDALERLRNRPERMPEPARAACKGSTGAELSGSDAGFLVGLAARADRLRADLAECQAWVETVTKEQRSP